MLHDPLDDMHVDEDSERYLKLLAAKSMAHRSSREPKDIYRMFEVTVEDVDNIEQFRQAAVAARHVTWNPSSSLGKTLQSYSSPAAP